MTTVHLSNIHLIVHSYLKCSLHCGSKDKNIFNSNKKNIKKISPKMVKHLDINYEREHPDTGMIPHFYNTIQALGTFITLPSSFRWIDI